MPRFVKVRRRLLRVVAPLSIVVAIAAYGAFLYEAHQSALRGQVTLHDTQQLGSSAHDRQNTKLDPIQGSIEIGRAVTRSASASWNLDPRAIDRPPDASLTTPRLFVAGLGLAFASRGGLVTVSLGGRTLDIVRPDVAGKLPPFGALNPPLLPIDIAPGYESLLVFDLPANDPCAATPCTLRIDTKGATWGVRRVGMILESTPQGQPLWNAPVNAVAIVGIALALALLVHIVRSVTLLIVRPIAVKR
jgi:hypothetical protein